MAMTASTTRPSTSWCASRSPGSGTRAGSTFPATSCGTRRLSWPATGVPCHQTAGRLTEPGDLAHLVHGVQGGDLVRLGQGRVVEHRVDQVVDGAAAAHDGLADVDELGGPGAEHVHAEQPVVIQADQELEHAVGIADDLAAGQLAVARDARLERHVVA